MHNIFATKQIARSDPWNGGGGLLQPYSQLTGKYFKPALDTLGAYNKVVYSQTTYYLDLMFEGFYGGDFPLALKNGERLLQYLGMFLSYMLPK